MRLYFYGAAGEVTGSCYLVESQRGRWMVDCGMFQGGRESRAKNLDALNFDLRGLDFVVVTHAHLDHSGLLPRLVALGYRGPIYATYATIDLLRVMLLDSAHIQEKEAEWDLRRRHPRRGKHFAMLAPLYTVAQAQESLKRMQGLDYDADFEPAPGLRLRLRDAGHILGSAIVEAWSDQDGVKRKFVFSGDLGQPARPVVRDPTPIDSADVLLVESTYGDRQHRSIPETEEELAQVIAETLVNRGGNVLIPAFSVGRTQELVFILTDLVRRGRIAPMPIYIDSPMSLAATEITLRHEELLDHETRDLIAWQRGHPRAPQIRYVETVEESIGLNDIRGGAIIISASGMCDAGRIKYHLQNNLPRRECALVIVGFQAAGTLGRRLVDGAREVRIFSRPVPVRASVHTIGGLSAHADRTALLAWLRRFSAAPERVFVVHGELRSAQAFAQSIAQELAWPLPKLPQRGEFVEFPGVGKAPA